MAQHRKKVSHARELFYILFIVVVLVLGAYTIWGPNGYTHLMKAQEELQVRQLRVDELKQQNTEKMDAVRGLKHDPQAVEGYAREKGYAREGEIIQRVPKKKAPQK
jgi:cell division protein FtsB